MKVNIGKFPKDRWYHRYLYEWFGYVPQQKIQVRIDPWDTWSMDCTLAEIILPSLLQLAKTGHGSAKVDNEDVPERLHGEDKVHERWDYVMSEMIYAFQHKVGDWDDEGDRMFCSPRERMIFERDQIESYERIKNGFRLFGKYYEDLWD
jgi:hypothetical protein